MNGDAHRLWTIRDTTRPISLNAERSAHWRVHRRTTAEAVERWAWLARQARIPHLAAVIIEAHPTYKGRKQDAGNCYPTVKAAIDALVAVGVLDDDTPDIVRAITLHAPDPSISTDGLTLVVREWPAVRLDLAAVGKALEPFAAIPLYAARTEVPVIADDDIAAARVALASLAVALT